MQEYLFMIFLGYFILTAITSFSLEMKALSPGWLIAYGISSLILSILMRLGIYFGKIPAMQENIANFPKPGFEISNLITFISGTILAVNGSWRMRIMKMKKGGCDE